MVGRRIVLDFTLDFLQLLFRSSALDYADYQVKRPFAFVACYHRTADGSTPHNRAERAGGLGGGFQVVYLSRAQHPTGWHVGKRAAKLLRQLSY